MCPSEVVRYSEGVLWRKKEQAQFDYILADLIGASMARVLSKDVRFPAIEDVYPHLFKQEDTVDDDTEEETRMINSQNRFLEFALKHNAKMTKGVENKT